MTKGLVALYGNALCVSICWFASMSASGASWYLRNNVEDWTSYTTAAAGADSSYYEPHSSDVTKSDTLYICANHTQSITSGTKNWEWLQKANRLSFATNTTFYLTIPEGVVATNTCRFQADSADRGTVVKRGKGTLVLQCDPATQNVDNSYWMGKFIIEEGEVWLPQDAETYSVNLGEVEVAAGATLYLARGADEAVSSKGTTYMRGLSGAGLVTNTCSIAGGRSLYFNAPSTNVFSGAIGGGVCVRIKSDGVHQDLAGDGSTFRDGSGIGLYIEGNDSIFGLHSIGISSVDGPSASDGRTARWYSKGVNSGFRFLNDSPQTMNRSIIAEASPLILDAGAYGALTFMHDQSSNSGVLSGYYNSKTTISKMQHLILDGSNTETCVFAPRINLWSMSAEVQPQTNCTFYITKRGSGTWRFGLHPYSKWCGGLAVEDGCLQFDSLAETNVNCSLGLATMLQEPYCGAYDHSHDVDYAIALGGSGTTPKLEYLGSNIVNVSARHIGLKSTGTIAATGCKRPSIGTSDEPIENPFGPARFRVAGVYALDGDGEKTLVLESETNSLPTVADISDGPHGGKVGVTKRGAGNALITGSLAFTGKVTVEKGTLYVNDGAHYRWFKFTPILTRYADPTAGSNNYSTQFAEFALYDKDGNRVNVGMAGEAFASNPGDSHPYGAGRDYTILTPNQAALGRFDYVNDHVLLTYDRGTRDSAGVITLVSLNSLVKIFDDLPAADQNSDTFYVYNRTKVQDTLQRSWLSLFMHVRNTVKEVSSYDVAFFKGQLGQSPYSWKFEGSVDGLNWDLLDEQTNHKLTGDADKTTAMNYWSYTNETKSAVQVAAGQVRKGWPIANAPKNAAVCDLPDMTIEVAAGASLVAEGDFTVSKIEVDASGEGVGTIDNFKLAPTGTLTVRNFAKTSAATVLPLAFANTDPSVLADWSLNVNGRNRPVGSVTVSDDGKVIIHPTGLLLLVR